MSDLNQLLSLAHTLADAAGKAIVPHFRGGVSIEDKGAGFSVYDPVTAADRAAEAAVRALIDAHHPRHGILGEEFGVKDGDGPWRWVLDPVDGTRGFLCGLLSWGTLIGLEHDGVPVLGVVDQPVTGERWWGTVEQAHWRGFGRLEAARSRPCARLEDAVLCCTHPDMLADDLQRVAPILERARMVRYGTDCMGYTLLATGQVDVVLEARLQPYDVVAHVPIIGAAGGRITGWDGEPVANAGTALAAGDPFLHAELLSLLRR